VILLPTSRYACPTGEDDGHPGIRVVVTAWIPASGGGVACQHTRPTHYSRTQDDGHTEVVRSRLWHRDRLHPDRGIDGANCQSMRACCRCDLLRLGRSSNSPPAGPIIDGGSLLRIGPARVHSGSYAGPRKDSHRAVVEKHLDGCSGRAKPAEVRRPPGRTCESLTRAEANKYIGTKNETDGAPRSSREVRQPRATIGKS